MITLEQLLKAKTEAGQPITDFKIVVQKTFDRGVLFNVYPQNENGETLDFMVSDNLLTDPKGGRLKRLAKGSAEKETITKDDIGYVEVIL